MSILTGGPYYHMVGRTGNNVGRVLRGKNVFSMRPSPSQKPPTSLQLAVRMRLAMMSDFYSWVTDLLDLGFQDYTAEMSAFNAAVSYGLRNAVTGVSPNFTVDYTKVMFSRGKLYNVTNPVAATAVGAVVDFTWTSVLYEEYASADDKVSIVFYNPALGNFVVKMNAALRSAQAYEMHLPLDWSGAEVNAWILTANAEGKMVSNTSFVSELTIL